MATILCFDLAKEEYGLDAGQVLGINPMMEITRVPQAPDFVEGVVRIREKVIPVIDLRKRFGIEKKEFSKKSRIIIVKIRGTRAGIIVDGVSSVMGISDRNLEPASPLLNHASFLKGVGKLQNRLLLLLDTDKILSQEEAEGLVEVHKKEKE